MPLRIAPADDESLVGFLVRLAERNGMEGVLAFSQSLGMPFSVLTAAATNPFDLVPLAEASLVSPSRLRDLAYWDAARRLLSFRGHLVSLSMVTLARRLVCLGCLAEDPYHRAAWDLSLAAACPRHAMLLLSSCPACGQRLRWTDPSIRRCRQGHDLARQAAGQSAVQDVEASSAIHRLLGLGDRQDLEEPPLPEAIMALGANAAMTLIFQLGWISSGRDGLPRLAAFRHCVSQLQPLLGLGYRAALGWPASYHAVLDRTVTRLSGENADPTGEGVASALRRILHPRASRPVGRLIRAETARFVSMHPAWWRLHGGQATFPMPDAGQPDDRRSELTAV